MASALRASSRQLQRTDCATDTRASASPQRSAAASSAWPMVISSKAGSPAPFTQLRFRSTYPPAARSDDGSAAGCPAEDILGRPRPRRLDQDA